MSTDLSATDMQQVLEERARKLARPVKQPDPGDMVQLVTFALANETYGVEARYVIEVFRLSHLSPLPGATPPVFGVVAWRGNLLVILDLRHVLGTRVEALNDLGRVIVLGSQRPAFGILVDTVDDTRKMPTREIISTSHGNQGREFVRGVTADALVVLDGLKLLQLYA